jgi:hypothetical protein
VARAGGNAGREAYAAVVWDVIEPRNALIAGAETVAHGRQYEPCRYARHGRPVKSKAHHAPKGRVPARAERSPGLPPDRNPAPAGVVDEAGLQCRIELIGSFAIEAEIREAVAAKVDLHLQDRSVAAQADDGL